MIYPNDIATRKSELSRLAKNESKRGRKQKPHIARDGTPVAGLYHCPDGRWRIVATGERYTEPDEAVAIAKFRQWQQRRQPEAVARISFTAAPERLESELRKSHVGRVYELTKDVGGSCAVQPQDELVFNLPEAVVWQWVAQQLRKNPDRAAQLSGLPQWANFKWMEFPQTAIQLEHLVKAYEDHANCLPASKRAVRVAWDEMVMLTGAKTAAELTDHSLIAYADEVKKTYTGSYAGDRLQRVKRVLSFAMSRPFDRKQIRFVLDLMAVLKKPKVVKNYQPSPVDRRDLAKLLKAADAFDTALILLALNCCMYADEVLAVDWKVIDLNAGTLVTSRGKTGIIRVAVLWTRTIKALQVLKQTAKPGAIFKSFHGKRLSYNRKSWMAGI